MARPLLSRLSPYADKLTENNQCWFGRKRPTTDQTFFAFVRYWKREWEYNESVRQIFIGFKKACDSIWREVLYNILIEFGVPMKLVRLIKIFLSETYINVRIGNHLSDTFLIQDVLKQGDA
jgi:hypothetical protein